MLLARLAEHQSAVEAVAVQALPLLSEDARPDPGEISRLRWQMVRALNAYQQFKHRELFDPAIARGNEQLRWMAEGLKRDCRALCDEFTAYVKHWSARGAEGHWTEYRAAAEAMNARIRLHLQRERQAIDALLRTSRQAEAPVWPLRVR